MEAEIVMLVIFALLIITGTIVVLTGVRMRGKAIEMAHKERLAMIERGMTPPASLVHHVTGERANGTTASRSLNLGIMMIGFGVAFGLIIGFAGQAQNEAMGFGGALVAIGAAMIVKARLSHELPPPPPPEIPR